METDQREILLELDRKIAQIEDEITKLIRIFGARAQARAPTVTHMRQSDYIRSLRDAGWPLETKKDERRVRGRIRQGIKQGKIEQLSDQTINKNDADKHLHVVRN